MSEPVRQNLWAAVRSTGGYEWIDSNTIKRDRDLTEKAVKKDARLMSNWAKQNLVVRVVRVEVRELREG